VQKNTPGHLDPVQERDILTHRKKIADLCQPRAEVLFYLHSGAGRDVAEQTGDSLH